MAVNWSDTRFVEIELSDDDRAMMEAEAGDHPTLPVAVQSTERMFAAIDEELAELVYWLWKNGIATEAACQDSGPDHQALIDFPSVDDLAAFLAIAVPQDDIPGGIWDRATGCNVDPDAPGMWEYMFFPKVTGRKPEFPVAVLFPLTDVPTLAERLRQAHLSAG